MSDINDPAEKILAGTRVLIVEDEPFIAFDIADAVEENGGIVLGPAMTIREALQLIEDDGIQAAILDVNLPDGDIGPVIEALSEKDAQLLIHSGAGLTAELRDRFPSLRVFLKPTPPAVLASILASSKR